MASIYEISRQFRKDLLQADAQALQTVVQAYGITYAAIMREIDRLILEAEEAKRRGEKVGESWLRRNDRLGILRTQIVFQIKQFADRVDLNLLNGQRVAVELALRESTEQIALAKEKAQIGFSFNRAPVEAIENLVGTLRDGPVQRLLARFPIQASYDTTSALIEGLALGKGPRETARVVRDSLGTPLNRALTITRTETLRAHRTAALQNYQANSDVVDGWIWTATKSVRTCPVCLAMDGTVNSSEEEFGSHPNCRCTPRPFIQGLPDKVEPASMWFAKQDEEAQIKVLGPKKAQAYRDGRMTLTDLVEETDHPMWGLGLREKSLAEAIGRRKAA